MDLALKETGELLLYIAPAMAANGTPVVAKRYYGKGHPIDRGILFIDGHRLLGDGKTWEGLLSGLSAGVIVGVVFMALFSLTSEYIFYATLSSIGALIGDITGSFIKRRLGIERGGKAPLLDQLDFYAGALALLYASGVYFHIQAILIVALIILGLHVATNRIAYLLGLKEVPW